MADLFALGSTIYEIMTGRQPYEDIPDKEVETLYRQQIFPTVETVPCGQVIKGCWPCEFKSTDEIMALIKCSQKDIACLEQKRQPVIVKARVALSSENNIIDTKPRPVISG